MKMARFVFLWKHRLINLNVTRMMVGWFFFDETVSKQTWNKMLYVKFCWNNFEFALMIWLFSMWWFQLKLIELIMTFYLNLWLAIWLIDWNLKLDWIDTAHQTLLETLKTHVEIRFNRNIPSLNFLLTTDSKQTLSRHN